MGTGPILLLDKSTFQMLSSREHLYRPIHFFEALTPILVTSEYPYATTARQAGGP
jgi:hypothetical protein